MWPGISVFIHDSEGSAPWHRTGFSNNPLGLGACRFDSAPLQVRVPNALPQRSPSPCFSKSLVTVTGLVFQAPCMVVVPVVAHTITPFFLSNRNLNLIWLQKYCFQPLFADRGACVFQFHPGSFDPALRELPGEEEAAAIHPYLLPSSAFLPKTCAGWSSRSQEMTPGMDALC